MQAGVLVSETSPDRRLEVYFSWHPDHPETGTGVLEVVVPRGAMIRSDDYVLHSSSLPSPLNARYNGQDWTVRSNKFAGPATA